MERTLLARDDLDWLPPPLKALRWTVAGSIWTGLAAVVAGTFMLSKVHFYLYGKGIAWAAAGGLYAGDRAARLALRRRVRRLASGAVDLSKLAQRADGELVHARGRVKAGATLPPLLDGGPVVHRRCLFSVQGQRVVHEAAVDFAIVDEQGERVNVEVEGAHLIAPDATPRAVDEAAVERLLALPLPAAAANAAARWRASSPRRRKSGAPRASELALRDGDLVEVVGWKARVIDPTVAHLERDLGFRSTLRSASELPLLIAPVAP